MTIQDYPRSRTAASMRAGMRTVRRTGLLLALCLGVGYRGGALAVAETFTSGSSTTTIEQSGPGVSRSEVTRYPDGHQTVTKDGSNTDISIQRAPSPRDDKAPNPLGRHAEQASAAARFDHPTGRDRRTWQPDDDTGPAPSDSSATAAEFRERILERLQRR